jgi:predicted nicotinamide N-methyase
VPVEPRLSFGRAVDAYERARPQYAADALAYLASRLPMRRVLDLGAGSVIAATAADRKEAPMTSARSSATVPSTSRC